MESIIEKTLYKTSEGWPPVKAFAWACDDENYYGERPDVVQDRIKTAEVLRNRYGYKTITEAVAKMDPVQLLGLFGEDVPMWYRKVTRSGFMEE